MQEHLEIAADGTDPRALAAALNRATDASLVLSELRITHASLKDRYLTMRDRAHR